jgi:beta-lactam-binding protein with PASTA domain
VPNVIGLKVAPARFYLRTAGFAPIPFNKPCSAGTLASQSVVVSLSVPGKPPTVTVGALPLVPGTSRPKGSRVGITWSECYPDGTQVPEVTGQTFSAAVHLLHQSGLNWACYSSGTTTTTHPPATTTTKAADATTSTDATTTIPPSTTTTTTKPPQTVLSQSTPAGTAVRAATVINLVMHHCPQ